MTSARDELLDALRAAIAEVSPGQTLEASFETPRQAAHGDLAVTAAMPLAKAQRRNPREVAAELIAALRAKTAVERWVEKIDVAGPASSTHLRSAARQRVVPGAGGRCGLGRAATAAIRFCRFVSPTRPAAHAYTQAGRR